jgi:aspartate racemase
MPPKVKKPYVIYLAEFIYKDIADIKKKNLDISNIDAIEGFIGTKKYEEISSGKFHDDWFEYLKNNKFIDKDSGEKIPDETIKHVKMGNIKLAAKSIKPAIKYLIKNNCKKIILGCTELPIAIFAFKSLKNVKMSKLYLDPNLILANSSMAKYRK